MRRPSRRLPGLFESSNGGRMARRQWAADAWEPRTCSDLVRRRRRRNQEESLMHVTMICLALFFADDLSDYIPRIDNDEKVRS